MSEIEIGEYVRTKEGIIDKVDRVIGMIENTVHLENSIWIGIKDIVKHSKNIIDLIEVGDVIEVYFPIKQITKKVFADKYFKDSLILDGIIQERIILKTILTHEMYKRNCYEVEE